MPVILAIESSCDDTAAAVISNGQILSNIVSSQTIHASFGGVVPELAARQHQGNIVPIVELALQKAEINKSQLDAVAFTQGPGLLGALMVGCSFAKSFAFASKIPLIGVNHLHAHLLSHWIEKPIPEFPFLCLLVSGGHTLIVKMENAMDYQIIGRTKDDAVGEAFDKAAKILGIPYPGGPLVDKLSQGGNSKKFVFPMPQRKELDFSFSGLKTAFLYFIQDNLKTNQNFIEENISDICASYQEHLVRYLLRNLEETALQTEIKNIGISGGVSANSCLREALTEMATQNGWKIYIPSLEYCTDNAAMIAITAHFKYLHGDFVDMSVAPFARFDL